MNRSAALLLVLFAASAACSGQPPDPHKPVPCDFHRDCPGGGVCFRGECQGSATCLERSQCRDVAVCEGQRCICPEQLQRCLPVCELDSDCTSKGQCLNGICTPYEPSFNAPVPGGAAKKPLEVGLGRADLDFPVGVSLAAYANRRGPNTPYQASLGGSNAWFDRPDVRAVAFDNGEELLVLLRLPLGWSTDELVTTTALKVQERIGINLEGKIISSATHAHSEPARFWHLVTDLSFGLFGFDEYSFEIFDRMTTSFADAVVMALETREPARFGWTVVERFDPADEISKDRRSRSDGLPNHLQKDNRMLIMRIDDPSGQPRAILTNLGVHGTVFGADNPIVTGDAPGAIEMLMTQKASEKYGRQVLGVFLQGNAGDISPNKGPYGHTNLEALQRIGAKTWEVIGPRLDDITTTSDLDLQVITGRVPLSHSILYGDGKFSDKNNTCEDAPPFFRYGAFQCVDGYLDDSDPATKFSDGDLKCAFGVECLTGGYPVPQFQKSVLSVVKLGDLVLPTIPGEPLSQYGRELGERVKAAVPGARDAFVLGYSQDHHFYLTTADDWFQGGYEPSRAIWGWQIAPYFQDQSVALAKELAKPRGQRAWDNLNLKPMHWPVSEADRKRVEPTETEGEAGAILLDVPEQIERLLVTSFAWAGGHPGVDQPHVTLERQEGERFAPVTHFAGWPYDDAMYEMLVRYEGTCTKRNCNGHRWRVEWEDTRDFPLGRYRFTATGHAKKGSSVVPYISHSRAFVVVPSRSLDIFGLRIAGGDLVGRALDPRRVAFVPDGERRIAMPAGHLLRSTVVPAAFGVPLAQGLILEARGTARDPTGAEHAIMGQTTIGAWVEEERRVVAGYNAQGQPVLSNTPSYATSPFQVAIPALSTGPAGAWVIHVTLTDPAGNSGTTTATVTK